MTLQDTLHKGYHIARTGRPGPVVIDLPKDVQNDKTKFIDNMKKNYKNSFSKKINKSLQNNVNGINKASELIMKAKRPIVYIGGLINSGNSAVKELKIFSNLSNFPVTSTLMGLGAFPASSKFWEC